MKTFVKTAMVLGLLFLICAPAVADWIPGMPAKWVQMPDLTDQGMDVNASWNPSMYTYHKVVADDFQCKETGPITDIHIWGSWLNDIIDPSATVKLSIHADVPAGVNAPYSHPAPNPLWQKTFVPGEYLMRPWATANERFYDPNLTATNPIIGFDTQVMQYNFIIPPALQFTQLGTAGNPVTYWLDVQVQPSVPDAIFGWKTSPDHWMDDSTFADTAIFGGPVIGPANPPVFWKDMKDPQYQFSLSQAFVVNGTPEPSTVVMLIGAAMSLLVYARRRWNR
jgi:hypothetical protein